MAVFARSLLWSFPVTLLRYFLNDFEVVTVALTITSIKFAFHSTDAVVLL